jgi:hypothetical protein
MDSHLNKLWNLALSALLAGFVVTSEAQAIEISQMKVSAITLAPIGVTDKPLVAFLALELKENSSLEEKWLSEHKAARFLRVQVTSDELQKIAHLITEESKENFQRRPFGTYAAAIWSQGTPTIDYVLTPAGASAVLAQLAKCEIEPVPKEILLQSLQRIKSTMPTSSVKEVSPKQK